LRQRPEPSSGVPGEGRTIEEMRLAFEDAGEYELKGVPDTWRLHRVVS